MMPPRIDGFRICQSRSGGHEVGAEEHALDAFDREQPPRQGRGACGLGVGEVDRPPLHDHAAGQELEGRWIGRLLGLNEQA